MRKLRTAAVVAAALGTLGILGTGTSYADANHGSKDGGGKSSMGVDFKLMQGSSCRSHDTNVDILGEVGIANGLAGNLLGGEGPAGAQSSTMGSSMGCNNEFGK
ncbi:hypothetical protein ACFY12_25325 [Streptomyces sp. NPDC001339]|uniref:hypothetical protein n=1 Tax=Streptomyces sp. NPDC001339 TaxID=3364563 RepID=UPI0036BA532F